MEIEDIQEILKIQELNLQYLSKEQCIAIGFQMGRDNNTLEDLIRKLNEKPVQEEKKEFEVEVDNGSENYYEGYMDIHDFLEQEREKQQQSKLKNILDNQIRCVFCQEIFEKDQKYINLPNCVHIFHDTCFQILYESELEQMGPQLILTKIKKGEEIVSKCPSYECQKRINLLQFHTYLKIIQEVKKQFEKITFFCSLCYQDCQNEDKIELNCKNQYCQKCLKKFIRDLKADKKLIHCPDCGKSIEEQVIKRLAPEIIQKEVEIEEQPYDLYDYAYQIYNGEDVKQVQFEDDNQILKNGLNQLTQCQKQALNYVSTTAKIQSDLSMNKLENRFLKLGHSQYVMDRTLQYIQEEAPITINFKLELLNAFIQDGHYKNCFEVRQGQNQGRVNFENQLFNNAYNGAKPKEKVKYGALNIYNDPTGIQLCQGYGSSFLVMKNIRQRTTFYDKDTFSFQKTLPLATCKHYGHILNSFSDQEIQNVVSIATDQVKFVKCELGSMKTYKEVQFHGMVKFSENVEMLFYNEQEITNIPKLKATIEQFSKKFNVPCLPIEQYQQQRHNMNVAPLPLHMKPMTGGVKGGKYTGKYGGKNAFNKPLVKKIAY